MGEEMNKVSIKSMTPFMEQTVFVTYINFLYWAYSCTTSGAYGDIYAVSFAE
jgi:hypothetical protein